MRMVLCRQPQLSSWVCRGSGPVQPKRYCFHLGPPQPLTHNLSVPLPILVLGGREYGCLICGWTFKHHILLSLWPLWASAVIAVHCKNKLLWQNLTAALKYRHKHSYLEDSLTDTPCSFIKTTAMPSTLGPMACSTMRPLTGFTVSDMNSLLGSGPQIQSDSDWWGCRKRLSG